MNTDGDENGGVIFVHLGARRVHGELLRKCRAIYQIALQIFIPFGEHPIMGNSFEEKTEGR